MVPNAWMIFFSFFLIIFFFYLFLFFLEEVVEEELENVPKAHKRICKRRRKITFQGFRSVVPILLPLPLPLLRSDPTTGEKSKVHAENKEETGPEQSH